MKINSVNYYGDTRVDCRKPSFGVLKIEGHNFETCDPKLVPEVKEFLDAINPKTFKIFSKVYNNQLLNNILDINIKKKSNKYSVFVSTNKNYPVIDNKKMNFRRDETAEVMLPTLEESLIFADKLAEAEFQELSLLV